MGTLADKLGYAIETKDDYIKEAIEIKGVTVGNSTLREYADRILEINTGGFSNLYFDPDNPPEDTNLIWVECDEPDKILISDVPQAVGITKTQLSATLQFNLCAVNAVTIGDKIYIPGAGYDGGANTNRIHVFDTTNDTISLASNIYTPANNYGYVGVVTDGTYFYTMGGHNAYTQYTDVFRYNISTGAVNSVGYLDYPGDVACVAQIGTKVYYTQFPWNGTNRFCCYDFTTQRGTSITANTINGQFGLFAIGENLFSVKDSVGIYKYNFTNQEWAKVLDNTDMYAYRCAITTMGKYAIIFCGSYVMVYDSEMNTAAKILDGEIAFAGNASEQAWAGWWACATKNNTVYCFGTNLKGGRTINKIVLNFDTILRLTTGDAPLLAGSNIELDLYKAYYQEVEISVYTYDETQQDWIEVIGNKVYDLTYAEDEEGF